MKLTVVLVDRPPVMYLKGGYQVIIINELGKVWEIPEAKWNSDQEKEALSFAETMRQFFGCPAVARASSIKTAPIPS